MTIANASQNTVRKMKVMFLPTKHRPDIGDSPFESAQNYSNNCSGRGFAPRLVWRTGKEGRLPGAGFESSALRIRLSIDSNMHRIFEDFLRGDSEAEDCQ